MKRGFFVVFEGGEGSGKSTQVEILASHLRGEGQIVTVTREPGGTRLGEQIRAVTHNPENVDLDPVTEAYLMAASRAQHVREVILPSLAAGRIVISDRFSDSSIAYQGYGRKLGPEVIAQLNELAVNGAIPDLTILLDVPPTVGIKRRHEAGKVKDRLDLESPDFYDRVYAGYLDLAKKHPERYVVIDATAPIEKVAELVWRVVKERLASRNDQTKT